MFEFLSLVCTLTTITGIVWWVQAAGEQNSISRRALKEPAMDEKAFDQTHYGRALQQVRLCLSGERVDIRWTFYPELEAKGFTLLISTQDDGAAPRQVALDNKSGTCTDIMKYGKGRIYHVTVAKEYVAFWGLVSSWRKVVVFDTISIAVRSGNLRESIEYHTDQVALDEVKVKAMAARAKLEVAKEEIPQSMLKKLKQLEEDDHTERKQLAAPQSPDQKIEALGKMRREMSRKIREVQALTDLTEEEKQEMVEDVRLIYDHQIAKMKEEL